MDRVERYPSSFYSLDNFRSGANLLNMVGEAWFKQSLVSELAHKSFVFLSGLYAIQEGFSLIRDHILTSAKDTRELELAETVQTVFSNIKNPLVNVAAGFLNMVFSASCVACFIGYNSPLLRVMGTASDMFPYCTNVLRSPEHLAEYEEIHRLFAKVNRPSPFRGESRYADLSDLEKITRLDGIVRILGNPDYPSEPLSRSGAGAAASFIDDLNEVLPPEANIQEDAVAGEDYAGEEEQELRQLMNSCILRAKSVPESVLRAEMEKFSWMIENCYRASVCVGNVMQGAHCLTSSASATGIEETASLISGGSNAYSTEEERLTEAPPLTEEEYPIQASFLTEEDRLILTGLPNEVQGAVRKLEELVDSLLVHSKRVSRKHQRTYQEEVKRWQGHSSAALELIHTIKLAALRGLIAGMLRTKECRIYRPAYRELVGKVEHNIQLLRKVEWGVNLAYLLIGCGYIACVYMNAMDYKLWFYGLSGLYIIVNDFGKKLYVKHQYERLIG